MRLVMYGMPELDERGHAGCRIADFCRNPLHPGPCKGWRRAAGVLDAPKPAPKKAAAPKADRPHPPGQQAALDIVKKSTDGAWLTSASKRDVNALVKKGVIEKRGDRYHLAGKDAGGGSEPDAPKKTGPRDGDGDGKLREGEYEKKGRQPAAAEKPTPVKASRARPIAAGQRSTLDMADGEGSHLSQASKRDVNALVKKGWLEQQGGPAGKYHLTDDGRAALEADKSRGARKKAAPAGEPAAPPKADEPAKPAPKKRQTAAEKAAAERPKIDLARAIGGPKSAPKGPAPKIDDDTYHALQALKKIPPANQQDPTLPGTPPFNTFLSNHTDSLVRQGYATLGGPKGRSPIMTDKGLAALAEESDRRSTLLNERAAGDTHASSFDFKNAAHDTDALDAAPNWLESSKAARRGELTGLFEGMSPDEAKGSRAAVDSYMFDGYFDINGSLHAGKGQPGEGTGEETRQKIDGLDRLFQRASTSRDSVLYRGTVLEGEPPNELTNPGFSSATSEEHIARDFSKGYYNGAVTGASRLPGKPTVYELRLPKGTKAINLSRYGQGHAAEVLLNRGARARKVADRGTVDGVRHVVYEVIPDGE